jgi:prepilin-type N-terminal cleavage/methylation domain-containing protein
MLACHKKGKQTMKKQTRKNGFTLVEIMIVVLIIGLLAAIAVPGFARARADARAKTCVNNLRLIEAAKDQWAMATNAAEGDAVVVADDEYIQQFKGNTEPVCPVGSTAYTVGVVGSPPECAADVTKNADNGYHALPQ